MPHNINIPIGGNGGGTATIQKTPPPDPFGEVLQKHFKQLDENGDGALSEDEVHKAVNRGDLKGQEAAMVCGLWQQFDSLSNVHEEEDRLDGITRADVNQYNRRVEKRDNLFQEMQKRVQRGTAQKQVTQAAREEWQRRQEVRADMLNAHPNLSEEIEAWVEEAEATYRAEKAKVERLKDAQNEDLERHRTIDKKIPGMWLGYTYSLWKIEATNQVGGALWAEDPGPYQIKQGGINYCYLIAGLAALANKGPRAIKDIIESRSKGQEFIVQFAGTKPIRIENPTDAEIGLFAHATKGHYRWNLSVQDRTSSMDKGIMRQCSGLWALVLCKAWAKKINDEAGGKYGCLPTAATRYFGLAAKVGRWEQEMETIIRVLTGHKADHDRITSPLHSGYYWVDPQTVHEKLRAAMARKKLVLSAIDGGRSDVSEHTRGHAYAVCDYEPNQNTHMASKVTFYNPHGFPWRVSLKRFCYVMDRIAYEQ